MVRTVCLDFDGVLNLYTGWKGENELFEPRPGVRSFLEKLRQQGYQVVIHSTRPPEKIQNWLCQHGLEDLVGPVSSQKPPAVVYLDDRGVCFRGDFWQALDAILSFQAHWEAGT